MIIIAERVNASRKPVREALARKDEKFFLNEVQALVERGSDFIDLNTSHLPEQELADLLWLIELIKGNFEIPLVLDSSTPAVIEAGLKKIGKPGQMINSTTLEPAKYERLFSLAQEYQAYLVVLLMGESAPGNAQERIQAMEKLAKIVEQKKISPERILVDALVFTLSTDTNNALYVMETIREVKTRFPEFKTLVGLSNISYGLPNRRLLNRTFLSMLIPLGLDAALIDPLDDELWATLKASLALSGKDPHCLGYLTAFRKGELGKKTKGD